MIKTDVMMEQVFREKGDTWPKILKFNYQKYGSSHRAMRFKHYGIWQPFTWEDYYLRVKKLAFGLLSLGLDPGDKLLIMGDNAPQWYCAELAVQAIHGISVGVYSDCNPREIKYIAQNAEVRFALAEDQEQVDKLLQIKDDLPLLEKIIYWNYKGLTHYDHPILVGYGQIQEQGKNYEEGHSDLFERNIESGKGDDVCSLVYTSGTTGPRPKGAVHSYKTMMAGSISCLRLNPWHERDNIVPFLPPVWMTEQWLGIGCHLLTACTLNFAEAPETLQRDVEETKPSIVYYSAYTWESRAAMVQARMHSADTIKRMFFDLLMPIGYRMADLRFNKQRPGIFLKIQYTLAHMLLFKPIKRSLGFSNVRICYTTGAMLSPKAFRFYRALGLPIKNLYSSTEGGILSGAKDNDIRLETLGPVSETAEVKIKDDGELICRHSGVFMGYYRDPDGTAEVLKEGWYHSGDVCTIKEDNHLVFIDRKNDLVELTSGYKFSPQFIECRLRSSPFIKDVFVFTGSEHDFVSAMIIIHYRHVGRWAGQKKVVYKNFAELSQSAEVYGLIENDINRINQELPPEIRIKKFINLHKELNPDEGEVTRRGTLRRTFLEKRYRSIIEAINSRKTEVSLESEISYRDGSEGIMNTTLSIKSIEEDDR